MKLYRKIIHEKNTVRITRKEIEPAVMRSIPEFIPAKTGN